MLILLILQIYFVLSHRTIKNNKGRRTDKDFLDYFDKKANSNKGSYGPSKYSGTTVKPSVIPTLDTTTFTYSKSKTEQQTNASLATFVYTTTEAITPPEPAAEPAPSINPNGGLVCFHCDAGNMEECKRLGVYRTCEHNEQSCMVEVRKRNNIVHNVSENLNDSKYQ